MARELTKLWQMMDKVCGKHMADTLPEWVKALERHGELDPSDEVREARGRDCPLFARGCQRMRPPHSRC